MSKFGTLLSLGVNHRPVKSLPRTSIAALVVIQGYGRGEVLRVIFFCGFRRSGWYSIHRGPVPPSPDGGVRGSCQEEATWSLSGPVIGELKVKAAPDAASQISPDAARQVILLVTSDLMGTVPIHRRHFAELLYATAGIEADVGRHMSGDVGMAFDNLMSSYMVLHSQCGQDIPSNIYSSLIWKLGTCLAVVEHSPKSLAGARMMNGQF
ncbi:hypothetical protein C8R43DRAFT_1208980 [Mycena crocata]|nr:hypothetical protein C8R43DRAFT_1208980 [Mycena crocata]